MRQLFNAFIVTLFIFFSTLSKIHPQPSKMSTGIYAGLSEIRGNSPAETAFVISIFFEPLEFSHFFSLRMSMLYARDLSILLPENRRNRYYPYIQGITLKAVNEQTISEKFGIEDGFGLLILNDRTFSDTDVFAYGFCFSAAIIYHFEKTAAGFSVGAGSEYGLTFTQTTPSYISYFIQIKYTF